MADFLTEVWVCPTHGIVGEDELAEGVDWAKGTSFATGDVAWTDRFYCQRDHADTDDSEVVFMDLAEPIRAALAEPGSRAQRGVENDAAERQNEGGADAR